MYQVHSITNRDSNAACKETVDNDDDLVSSSVQDTYKIQKKKTGGLMSHSQSRELYSMTCCQVFQTHVERKM